VTSRLVVIALAVAALLVPLPPSFVEQYYSSAVFPFFQPLLTGASNVTAIAWFDVATAIAIAMLLIACGRDLVTMHLHRAVWRILVRIATAGSITYLVFLCMWGLNYRRQSLRQRVPFESQRITADAAIALARESVTRANSMYALAHREGWIGAGNVDPALAMSFRQTTQSLGWVRAVLPGRPKRSLLDLYFRRAGVAGMTDPFFLETLVASDLLPFERPQVIAHEWAHLAGITDEGEANFVGWLTCVRGSVPDRYSGWLFLHSEVVAALPRQAARQVTASLDEGPRADLVAIRDRYEREVSPRISGAGWQVYDQYLKANRVDAGTASYAQVVQLILGTQLR
jgi:hypothetical protein